VADQWLKGRTGTIALFLTDLHIGSRWGLWNPDCGLKESVGDRDELVANNVQVKLWEYWLDLCEKLRTIKPDLIFLLGDIINGSGGRGRQSLALTTDLSEQAACALSILRRIPRKTRTQVLGLIGSSSYDQAYLEENKRICDELGGRLYGTTGIFVFNGRNFRVYHGSTTAYIYLESVMGRRRAFAQEAIAGRKLPEIEGIICGHSHRWLHVRTMWRDGKDFHIVLCPGWEGQTDFMVMKDPDKMIPEIGAVLGRFGRDLVDFQCIRYPTPLGMSSPVCV
jgi:UDP-2,3-diacylglucosamine pyrophosphatase LpxH